MRKDRHRDILEEAILDGGPVTIERWRMTCPFCDPIQRRPQVVEETAAFWVLAGGS